MWYAIAALVGLLVLVGGGSLLLSYGRFLSCIEVEWRDKVLNRYRELVERSNILNQPIHPVNEILQKERERVFAVYLNRFSVYELQQFHGIGPKTIQLLKDAGYHKISDLVQQGIESRLQAITGIGSAKASDITAGLKQLLKSYSDNFQTQNSPEYQAFADFEKETNARHQFQTQHRHKEIREIETLLQTQSSLWGSAGQINFLNFLLGKMPRITKEIADRPLPEVPKLTPSTISPPSRILSAEPVSKPIDAASPVPKSAPILEQKTLEIPAPSTPTKPTLAPATQLLLDQLYLVARFGILVGKADGRLAKDERKVVRAFLAEEYGSHEIAKNHIDPALEKIEKESLDEGQILAGVKKTFSPAFLRRLLEFAEKVAGATGTPNAKELAALKRYEIVLGVEQSPAVVPLPAPVRQDTEPVSKTLVAKSVPLAPSFSPPAPMPVTAIPVPPPPPKPTPVILPAPTPDYREILEIEKGVELSPELIRRKYNLLWDRSDPKKAESMGKKFVQLAEETRKSVREAAEKLIAPFGVTLEVPQEAPPADIRHNPDLDDVFGM